jgi:hypothetical protein
MRKERHNLFIHLERGDPLFLYRHVVKDRVHSRVLFVRDKGDVYRVSGDAGFALRCKGALRATFYDSEALWRDFGIRDMDSLEGFVYDPEHLPEV